jgi:hypothetical protein
MGSGCSSRRPYLRQIAPVRRADNVLRSVHYFRQYSTDPHLADG